MELQQLCSVLQNIVWLLRIDPHGNPIQNWDVAGASEGDANVLWFQPGGRTRLQLMCCAHR